MRLDVYLVKNKFYNENEETILEKHLRERVGDEINIKYIFVNRIKPGKNGKIMLVINNFLPN